MRHSAILIILVMLAITFASARTIDTGPPNSTQQANLAISMTNDNDLCLGGLTATFDAMTILGDETGFGPISKQRSASDGVTWSQGWATNFVTDDYAITTNERYTAYLRKDDDIRKYLERRT
jgi:hypothetical protein